MEVAIRLVDPADAAPLARLLQQNRTFLAPYEPARPEDYFTAAGQSEHLADALRLHEGGRVLPCVITLDGVVVGRITLNNIVHGAFDSADLGYWVAESANGRGVATAATAAMLERAFGDLGLHRVQAGTLLDNTASQRVLAHNGFEHIGLAPRFLRIAGRWQDHLLFQRLADDPG